MEERNGGSPRREAVAPNGNIDMRFKESATEALQKEESGAGVNREMPTVYKRRLTEVGTPADRPDEMVSNVNNVHNNLPSKKRQKFKAEDIRQKLERVTANTSGATSSRSVTLEGPVKGRSNVGKVVAMMVKDITGDGPAERCSAWAGRAEIRIITQRWRELLFTSESFMYPQVCV